MVDSELYGECVGNSAVAAVRIKGLAGQGCNLETREPGAVDLSAVAAGDVSLWIGAIGPVAATAERHGDREFSLRFKEPLDSRILSHFSAA